MKKKRPGIVHFKRSECNGNGSCQFLQFFFRWVHRAHKSWLHFLTRFLRLELAFVASPSTSATFTTTTTPTMARSLSTTLCEEWGENCDDRMTQIYPEPMS